MTNEEAIKAIKSNYPPSNYTMLREALDLAMQVLEKQIVDKWIPVGERLPKDYGGYLVAWRPTWENADDVKLRTNNSLTHYYEILEFDPDDENGWIDSIEQCDEYHILAWKPLPEPYRRVTDDNN